MGQRPKESPGQARWTLDPLVGVAPLRFGMSPDKVSAVLDGAVAYASYDLGGGAGWGYYLYGVFELADMRTRSQLPRRSPASQTSGVLGVLGTASVGGATGAVVAFGHA
ncbi:hypothetical protein ACICHK_34930 [Streptomyces sp. AHU1]|uniref:hypothetical protein n=1 Tax=Streptomyces sp. AHU1 TaxID=3377215 RepID=UPI00387801F5